MKIKLSKSDKNKVYSACATILLGLGFTLVATNAKADADKQTNNNVSTPIVIQNTIDVSKDSNGAQATSLGDTSEISHFNPGSQTSTSAGTNTEHTNERKGADELSNSRNQVPGSNPIDGWSNDQYYRNGQAVLGDQEIDGNWYNFGTDGHLQKGVQKEDDTYYFYDLTNGRRIYNDYVQSQWGTWYLFGSDGRIQTDVQFWAGTYYYFDHSTFLKVTNNYVQSRWGLWYLFGNDGGILTDVQFWAGTYYYFDHSTFLKATNGYLQARWGSWYMFADDGQIVTGLKDWYGSKYYFDPVTYLKVINQWVNVSGNNYYFDTNGVLTNHFDVQSEVNIARQLAYMGIPYVYGGNTLGGMDCSGLVQYVFARLGVSLPHYTAAQENYTNIHAVNQAQTGDLLFWGGRGSSYHVAIYIGNNQYVDAPAPGQNVSIHNINGYFMPNFAGTVRM